MTSELRGSCLAEAGDQQGQPVGRLVHQVEGQLEVVKDVLQGLMGRGAQVCAHVPLVLVEIRKRLQAGVLGAVLHPLCVPQGHDLQGSQGEP